MLIEEKIIATFWEISISELQNLVHFATLFFKQNFEKVVTEFLFNKTSERLSNAPTFAKPVFCSLNFTYFAIKACAFSTLLDMMIFKGTLHSWIDSIFKDVQDTQET